MPEGAGSPDVIADAGAPSRGVILQPIDEPAVFVAMAEEIEALGYADLWCTDSSLHARNAYAYLTLASTRTERLGLGTAVTNPLTRHPAITAVAATTVDEISGGRFTLGIGVGDRPLLALGYAPGTLANLEASMDVIRRLWRGETVEEANDRVVLHDAHLRFPARDDLKIYVSASGPKTLELAGRIADGVLVLAGLFDKAARWAIDCIDRGARAANRPRPHVAFCAYGAIDDEEERALLAGRGIAAWFPQTAPVICELAGLDPAVVEAVRRSYQGGEFQEAAQAAALLPVEFVRQVALAGNATQAAERIHSVLAAGADSVQLFPLGPRRMETIRAFPESWESALRRVASDEEVPA
jgi:5,10-methylenetetrahydromethanopterin reductase